jgi:hypothetical protein
VPAGTSYAASFDVIVLCAREIQPVVEADIEVIRCPMGDNYEHMPEEDMMSAMRASAIVQRRLLQGKKVLSACYHGRNRSGLVSAMSLVRTFGMRPSMAIQAVRSARRNALQNPQFLMFLMAGERLPSTVLAHFAVEVLLDLSVHRPVAAARDGVHSGSSDPTGHVVVVDRIRGVVRHFPDASVHLAYANS